MTIINSATVADKSYSFDDLKLSVACIIFDSEFIVIAIGVTEVFFCDVIESCVELL